MSSASSSIEVEPSQGSLNLREGNRTRSRRSSPAGEKVKRLKDDPVRKLYLEKVAKDLSSPEDPRSQQSKLMVRGENVKPGVMVKKRRNNTKSPAERCSIDSGNEDEVGKFRNELSTAMQQISMIWIGVLRLRLGPATVHPPIDPNKKWCAGNVPCKSTCDVGRGGGPSSLSKLW